MLLVLATLAALASAEPTSSVRPAPVTMDMSAWERRPSGRDLQRAYPRKALAEGLSGFAAVACEVTADGLLTNCKIDSEGPPGYGFGEAAMSLMPLFKLRSMTPGGQSREGGTVRIPIRFGAQGDRPRVRPEISACYGLVAHAVEQDPTLKDGWRGVGYWSIQVLTYVIQRNAPPSDFEHALAVAHQMAAGGTLKPPKGWDLAACLAEVPKQ